MKKYELLVIGTGPAGEKAAVKAAYFGHKVAIIEKSASFGGAGVQTGTLPSKTLKETALYLSGKNERGLYGIERDFNRELTVKDFLFRKDAVVTSMESEVKENLVRHGVDIYHGTASFKDANTLVVGEEALFGDSIIIATGSYPFHPPMIPFDAVKVHDSDTILEIKQFPSSICIVGAGVIGCEYATIFAAMGTKVFLINDKKEILAHLDNALSQELVEQMKQGGVEIEFNTTLKSVEVKESVLSTLSSGKIVQTDMFLFAAGRSGNTKDLNLNEIGVKTTERGAVIVDKQYRTSVPHIFAVGDVIGFPALASTSMDQGRVAVAHIFQTQDLNFLAPVFPLGIYTIPEISMIGLTEEEAKKSSCNFCTGTSLYKDMARGKIMGTERGLLKLVFDKESLTVLGVHIIGPIACELIHYGMLLIKDKKNLYDVIGEIFNYPTLHDLYKYAAYDGLSNLSGHKIKD